MKLFHVLFDKRLRNIIYFSCAIVFNLLSALLEGISFAFFLFGFNALMGANSAALPMMRIFNNFFSNSDGKDVFVWAIICGIVSQIIRSMLNFAGQFTMTSLATKLQNEVQKKIYDKIFQMSFRSISQYKMGDLVEYAKSPTILMVPVVDAINRIILSILMIISLSVCMIFISPTLTFIMGILLCFLAISQKKILKKISDYSSINSENIVELTKHTVQNLYGLKAVLTFGRTKETLNKIEKSLLDIRKSTFKVHSLNQLIGPFNEIIGVIFVGATIVIGVFVLQKNALATIPALLTFLTLTYRLSGRVPMLMSAVGCFSFYKGDLKRLSDILSDHGKEFSNDFGNEFGNFKNSIEFKHVKLNHDQTTALNNVCLNFKKGKIIALVGGSGAGKSSIVDLLIKLYEPNQGKIFVDGVDLKNYNSSSWRKILGVVSQDAILFNESIEENIRFGHLGNNIKVIEAAKMAGAHEFISALPLGYQTIVGEKGYKLSGGEKQRIAIARAILRNPEILVLDEATSNLDSLSESLIQEMLQKLKSKKTIIIIAHRLSTVTIADHIYVIEQGNVVEEGNHHQLLSAKGKYHSYWNLQTDVP